jgi:hypothetical protein
MTSGRRYRGIVGLALTWGVTLSVVAMTALGVGYASGRLPFDFSGWMLTAAGVRGFVTGAFAGALFGWLLSSREKRQTLSTLSQRRVALWGFIASIIVPTVMMLGAPGVVPVPIMATAILVAGAGGSILGVGMLRIARKAPMVGAGDEPTALLR